jgi:DNA-binding NtrC family response regulator
MIHWQPGVTLDTVERDVIERALRFFEGNKAATARSLGIAVRTLDNKLASYEEQVEQEKKHESVRQG